VDIFGKYDIYRFLRGQEVTKNSKEAKQMRKISSIFLLLIFDVLLIHGQNHHQQPHLLWSFQTGG